MQKGFTLIELLVVVSILAIISLIVLFTLNPAETLRQARDSTRLSDMATIKHALSIFLSQVPTSSVALGAPGTCYMSTPGSSTCQWFATAVAFNISSSKNVNGTGWIPVNFTAITSGVPFSNLPTDPSPNQSHFYSYITANSTYKLAAKMESAKYNFGGPKDVVSTDGGNESSTYETGSNLSL